MQQYVGTINVRTQGRGLYDATRAIRDWVDAREVGVGLLTVFIRHTSASLTIQENADSDVLRDLDDFFTRTVPDDSSLYRHTIEGPDDMPAHIRSALTTTQLSIPVEGSQLQLGIWQAVYVFEHRTGAFIRSLALHLLAD